MSNTELLGGNANLCFGICHGSKNDSHRQHGYSKDLPLGEAFAPDESNNHGRHATTASEDDVYWYRNVIAKGKVVEHVDGKEENDVWDPYSKRNGWCLEEKWWLPNRKVRWQSKESGDDELGKGDQKTCHLSRAHNVEDLSIPLSGSSLSHIDQHSEARS